MADDMTAKSAIGWRSVVRPGLRNRLVLCGMAIVLLLVVLAVFASTIAPYDPTEMKVMDALKGPSSAHWFGTDRYGRDVLSRTIHGSRIALGVALSSMSVAFVVGSALGLVAGFVGGWSDLAIGRVMDVLFSFPTLVLAVAISAMLVRGWTTRWWPLSRWSTSLSSAASLAAPLWPSGRASTCRRRSHSALGLAV